MHNIRAERSLGGRNEMNRHNATSTFMSDATLACNMLLLKHKLSPHGSLCHSRDSFCPKVVTSNSYYVVLQCKTSLPTCHFI